MKSLLAYDPETGDFTRKVNVGNVAAGTKAGSYSNGYIVIGVCGDYYFAHRLAFLYMTGSFPANQVDHIDCDRANNRWNNLREATQGENTRNRPPYGAVPLKGVTEQGGRFRARLRVGKKDYHLGYFNTAEEAHEAWKAKARELHGEFFRDS